MRMVWTRVATFALSAAGVAFTARVGIDWAYPNAELAAALVTAAAVLIFPAARRPVLSTAGRLRAIGPRGRLIGVFVVALVWAVAVPILAALHHLPTQLLWHDEHQFYLQSRMLAHGRLWMPPHPIGDFFDTFYVLMTPKYAPQSFPGAALMFVPTIWLSLPTWLMPVLVAGLAAGLVWWVIGELTDPATATVAAIVLLGCSGMRRLSTMYLAQVPALLLGMIAVVGWLQYRKTGNVRWVGLIGAALGWGLITRPLDAACYGLIVGVATIALWCRRRWPHVLRAAALGVVCAAPFMGLQLIFNHGITGSWTKTPFTFYNERDQPALAFGGVGDRSRRPLSIVPQKSWFYDAFTLGFIREAEDGAGFFHHADLRINRVGPMITPSPWAIPLAFVGLLGLTSWRRIAVAALLPLFVTAYAQYPIYLFHYIAFAMPAVVLLYALSPRQVAACVPSALRPRAEAGVIALLLGFIVSNVYAHVPEPNMYDPFDVEDHIVRRALSDVQPPAIVLFKPHPAMTMDLEPVYNDTVLWPDDASVIKAHWLGPDQNPRLFAYYAASQPGRGVYVFDRGNGRLTRLDNVADLARQFPTTRP